MITKINSINNNLQYKPAFKGTASITTDVKGLFSQWKYDRFSEKCQDFMFRTVFTKGIRLSVQLETIQDKVKATVKCPKEFNDKFEILAQQFAKKNRYGFKFDK